MTVIELMNSFKENTGVSVLRTSREGVLIDYNVITNFPDALGAFIATAFGASESAVQQFPSSDEIEVVIDTDTVQMYIISAGRYLLAGISSSGKKVEKEKLRELARSIRQSEP